jgi:hypothetical protein
METTARTAATYWDDVPLDDETAEAARLGGRDPARDPGYGRFRMPRRSLMKTAGVLGTALALNVVGALSNRLTPRAWATPGSYYTSCNINYSDSVICDGAPYSSSYCGSDGWFIQISYPYFSSWPTTACSGRNAWWWWNYRQYMRCADGMQQATGSSPVYRICLWPV